MWLHWSDALCLHSAGVLVGCPFRYSALDAKATYDLAVELERRLRALPCAGLDKPHLGEAAFSPFPLILQQLPIVFGQVDSWCTKIWQTVSPDQLLRFIPQAWTRQWRPRRGWTDGARGTACGTCTATTGSPSGSCSPTWSAAA